MKILMISGSLRAASYNHQLLQLICESLPATVTAELANIATLPLYNEDLDGEEKPQPVQHLLNQINAADALLISSPEYNYNIPGGLKNALDWASRPAFESPLKDKPTAVIVASATSNAGLHAQEALRDVLACTLTPQFNEVEFNLGATYKAFNKQGELANKADHERLLQFVGAFINWVENRA